MKETRDTVIASEVCTLRPAQGAFGKGSGEMVSRKGAHHPPGIDRRAGRSDGPIHLLAGADRSRRRSACAGRSERSGAVHRCARPGGMDDPDGGERRDRNLQCDRAGDAARLSAKCWMGSKRRSDRPAKFTWIQAEFLEKCKRSSRGRTCRSGCRRRAKTAAWGGSSIRRALAKGLTFRPLAGDSARYAGMVQVAARKSVRRNCAPGSHPSVKPKCCWRGINTRIPPAKQSNKRAHSPAEGGGRSP